MRRVVQESSDAFLFSDYWSDVSPSCINKTFILCTVGKKKKIFQRTHHCLSWKRLRLQQMFIQSEMK